MEDAFSLLADMKPAWIYLAVFLVAYLENLIPPLPSDLLIVFAGSLVAAGLVDFSSLLVMAATGSTFGFLTMFLVGRWWGPEVLSGKRFRFLPRHRIKLAGRWFRRYGYWVIVANRFLAGTRAVVSFFAGMSRMSLARAFPLSFAGSLIWSFLLLFAGRLLGENWNLIYSWLRGYGAIVTGIVVIIAFWLVFRKLGRRKARNSAA